MVDIVVLLIVIFFALAGLRKGLSQYLVELTITASSSAFALIYYLKKHTIFNSLLVFLWVFLCLSLLNWFLLRARRKRTPQNLILSFAKRFWGGFLGFIWGSFIAGLLILAFDILPSETIFKYNIKENVHASAAYNILQRLIPENRIGIVENLSYMSEVNLDEEAKLRLSQQPQFQELIEHESLKAIMEDEEIVRQLQNKDLPLLLTNPKILNLLNDGEFIEKLMQLDFKKALSEN